MDLSRHIKELLYLHDCVILPGLGGFVANYKPAEFDTAGDTVHPPSKHLLFNPQLIHNDGLLYAHISGREGYGYKDVEKIAGAWIEVIRKDTRKGMQFRLEGIGYFYQGNEGQLNFREEAGNNFLLDSYGLPLVHYKSLGQESFQSSYRNLRPETDPLARKKRIRAWAYGTAAAVLLAAMVVVPFKSGMIRLAGSGKPQTELGTTKPGTPVSGTPEVSTAGIGTAIAGVRTVIMPEPEYHIVVGSFRDFGNARELRNQVEAKGYKARILAAEKGYYRVTAGTYTRHDDALSAVKAVFADYDQAWVLTN